MEQQSNRLLSQANFFLCAIYWIGIYPISHLSSIFDADSFNTISNLLCVIFMTLISANCLWYLNRNLIIHKSPILKPLLIGLICALISIGIHYQKIVDSLQFILPYLSILIIFFSLHQIRYKEEKRNHIILLLLIGNTLNVIIQDSSLIMHFQVNSNNCDTLLAGISIIISMYLLLRSKFTVFDLIGNLFALIILLLYLLHHLNIQFILINFIPFMILISLLCKENLKIGLSILAIMSICIWVCYYLEFFDSIHLKQEFYDFINNLKSDLRTAKDFFFFGNGFDTFPYAHLQSNPNLYTEKSHSGVLYLVITGGFLALLQVLILWGAMIRYSFGAKITISQQISNLALILPFVTISFTTNETNESLPLMFATIYILWYISCQHTIIRKNVTPLDIKIRRVPIVICTSAILVFSITGILSTEKFNDISRKEQCEDLNSQIINPFVLGKKLVEYDMQCVHTNLTIMPVRQWLDLYKKLELTEIIPYRPRKEIFINLINFSKYYTDEENDEIKQLAEKLYPTIMTELEGPTNGLINSEKQ